MTGPTMTLPTFACHLCGAATDEPCREHPTDGSDLLALLLADPDPDVVRAAATTALYLPGNPAHRW